MKSLKLTKVSWIILALGVFVVVVISLALTRSQQINTQSQLTQELSVAEARLSKLQGAQQQPQQEELQSQLDAARAQLEAIKKQLGEPLASIDVTDEFYAIARSCNTTVESIGSAVIKKEKLAGVNCSVISLGATVSGETLRLVEFIRRLNNDYTTGVVRSAQITIPEDLTEDSPSVDIQMVVYAYEGG